MRPVLGFGISGRQPTVGMGIAARRRTRPGGSGWGVLMTNCIISYTPKILKNMKEICEEMGVCEKVVRRWVACGAPIAVEGEGTKARYSAELMRLQLWREVFGKEQAGE